jgi:hypothetical protein
LIFCPSAGAATAVEVSTLFPSSGFGAVGLQAIRKKGRLKSSPESQSFLRSIVYKRLEQINIPWG